MCPCLQPHQTADNPCIQSDQIFTATIKDNCFRLSVSNTVLQSEMLEGSTGVGLKTCQKIILDMKGSFKTERTGDTFCVTILEPLCPEE